MFYKRIQNLEDEDNSMAAPMPPEQKRVPQFGQSSFGPALPSNLRKRCQPEHDSEIEREDTCDKCHRSKRSKREGNNKRKAIDEVESESDEENYRGLSRITLVSCRKRLKTSRSVFSGLWDTK